MKPILLLLILSSSAVSAQVINPVDQVISNDYISLIKKGTNKNSLPADSTNSIRRANLELLGSFNVNRPVKRIILRNNKFRVYNHYTRQLTIGGLYSSSMEFKTINRLPALQDMYAQGSSQNGELKWQGPETGEIFSFGPAIQSLEFDGTVYPYDINGKLVAAGSGNGVKANNYNNTVFRTAPLFTQSLTVHGSLLSNGIPQWTFNVKLGQTTERLVLVNNKNTSKNMSASIGRSLNKLKVSGTYSYWRDNFSNSNRNGFLNRVYQNALLSPASFDNSQGTMIGNAQRSYSGLTDNPFFLLENSNNSFSHSQHNANLALEQNTSKLRFKLLSSFENIREISNEGYAPGSAFFTNGIATHRNKKDHSWFVKANAFYNIDYSNYKFRSTISTNYIFTDAASRISYTGNSPYNYQRSSHDISLGCVTSYQNEDLEAGLDLGNKFYISNTAVKNGSFLPAIGSYIRFNNIILHHLSLKIVSTFNRFNNELPVSQSLANANLLRYATHESFQYFPVLETKGFDKLLPIKQGHWAGRIELDYKSRLSFSGEVFIRNIQNDIFPVYQNDELLLKNIVNHQNKGFELQLSANQYNNRPKLSISHTLSFITWKTKVTEVADGYNYTPIAGFSNVHKAIVKGEVMGAIMGNTFLRGAHNNIIIGADGFPMVNNQLSVIGNPVPDFVMKLGNIIHWKSLSVNLDLEWKKGGEAWNGTQATLDYYGRSKNSAVLRNTTNYVFAGITEDGHINTTPVNFYDPALPVQNNRWARYGPGGVAEEYIEKADHLRLNTLSVSYKLNFKKFFQQLTLAAYTNNIVLWTAYKGTDPGQLLFDQLNTTGLDFFNLPSTKTFGLTASIQF